MSTGPYYKSYQTPGPSNQKGAYKYFRTWHRQPRPRIKPLPFSFSKTEVLDGDQYSVDNMTVNASDLITNARNRAYSRFRDEFYSSTESQMVANLAERRQTINLIVKRATQLRRFTVAVKQFKFDKAARILGLDDVTFRKKIRPRLKRSKGLAGNWIEYHFGWDPLIKDLGTAMDVLEGGIPPPRVKGSAKAVRESISARPGHWSETGSIYELTNVRVRMGATISIVNPNLHLAASMGFVNPISVAWELVPFSFIADWFVNFGSILQSMTDFVGANVENAYTTVFTTSRQRVTFKSAFTPGVSYIGEAERVTVDRTLGISGPSFEIKPFRGFSPVRGATAIALLVQVL